MGVSVRQKVRNSNEYWVFVRHHSLKGGRWSRKIEGTEKHSSRQLALALAEKLKAKIQLLKPDERLFDLKSESPLLRDYFKKFLKQYCSSVRPSTRVSYEGCYKKYIDGSLGSLPLDQITRQAVKEFITKLKTITYRVKRSKTESSKDERRSLSKDSIRITIAVLRKILNEAKDDGLLQSNPAERQGKYYREVESLHGEIDPFNADEAKLFLETASRVAPWYFATFATLLHGGLRLGEALALRWPDLDFKRKIINVRRSVSRNKQVGKTKTSRSRQVEMSDFLYDVLIELRKQREAKYGRNLPEYVFINQEGTQIDPSNLRYQQFNKILKSAGLRKIRIHDLRHSFCTLHLQSGSPLQWVSKMLGHASIKMTADVYFHFLPDAEGSKHRNSLPAIATPQLDNVVMLKR